MDLEPGQSMVSVCVCVVCVCVCVCMAHGEGCCSIFRIFHSIESFIASSVFLFVFLTIIVNCENTHVMAEICNVEINERKFKKFILHRCWPGEHCPQSRLGLCPRGLNLIGWFFEDRLPLIYITALLRIAKESLHLSQPISMLYCISFF